MKTFVEDKEVQEKFKQACLHKSIIFYNNIYTIGSYSYNCLTVVCDAFYRACN